MSSQFLRKFIHLPRLAPFLRRELRVPSFTAVALGMMLALTSTARAQFIQYAALDLADTTPGEDLWEYSYLFSGFDFQANQGFSIYFDHNLYTALQDPRPDPSAFWDMLAVQPDVILQQPGFLDGLALINSPPTAVPFEVTFVWLGAGTPGAQPFEFYDSDFQPYFSSVSVVPEPSGFLLLSAGALLLSGWRAARLRQRN